MRADVAAPNPVGLDIYGCPALARRYKHGVGSDRHLVSHIRHDSCDDIIYTLTGLGLLMAQRLAFHDTRTRQHQAPWIGLDFKN